jgi:hypothetical protein
MMSIICPAIYVSAEVNIYWEFDHSIIHAADKAHHIRIYYYYRQWVCTSCETLPQVP